MELIVFPVSETENKFSKFTVQIFVYGIWGILEYCSNKGRGFSTVSANKSQTSGRNNG